MRAVAHVALGNTDGQSRNARLSQRQQTTAARPPKRTDKETLERLLASDKLTTVETTDIQQSHDAVVAGKELDAQQRLRANVLYEETYKLGEERTWAGRRRDQAWTDEPVAKFDAMPRPKKPPGR